MEVHRGEVFYADLSPVVGSEQGGIRPVLIIQNEIGNRHSPTVIAAAITSRQDKNRLPTHISVRADRCGLAKDSIILTEQIRTLDKRRLRELIAQHVKTHMGARCLAVTEAGVQVEGPDGSVQLIPADTVAVALGMRANDTGELEALVQRAGVPCHKIGDCVRARKIYDAVSEGYLTALSL